MKDDLQYQTILFLERWFIIMIFLHIVLILGLQFDDSIKLDTDNYEKSLVFFGIEGIIFIFSLGVVSLYILGGVLFRAIKIIFMALLTSFLGLFLHFNAYRKPTLIEIAIMDLREYTLKERIKDAIELRTIKYAIKMPYLMSELRK